MRKLIQVTNYDRLLKIIPSIKDMKIGDYLKLKRDGFMDLNINVLSNSNEEIIFSLSHNSLQNGDVMADPDMEVRLLKKHSFLDALTFKNDYMGVFQQVYFEQDGKKYVRTRLRKQLNSFLRTWLINLKNQGFRGN